MDIERLSLGAGIRLILRHRRLRQRGIQVFKAALREFFLPQFLSLLFPGIRPVAVISHPLDDSLPFDPRLFHRYLGYFTVWMKTLSGLYRIYGNPALEDIEEMMRGVARLYDAAGRVYRHCQSTTTSRRTAPANPYFLLVFLFDPHLHCIPSLHILTICYNYHQASRTVMRRDPYGVSGSRLSAAAYRAALRITEAILLVKQHSLLDIGPSLFLLSRLFPEYGEREIRRFVSDLFADTSVLEPCAAAQARQVILKSYEQLLARHRGHRNSTAPEIVLDYLREILKEGRNTARKGLQQAPP